MLRAKHVYDQKGGTSKLTAVFGFGEDTAPKDRSEVNARMNINSNGSTPALLINYLNNHEDVEFVSRSAPEEGYQKFVDGQYVQIRLRRHCRGLGVTIRADAKGKMEPLQMLDLRAIDEYIRTGKSPPKENPTTGGPAP